MNTPLILRNLAYKLHREERITDDVAHYIREFADHVEDSSSDRLKEEHKEMLEIIKYTRDTTVNERIFSKCNSLITKIESK